jgi:hypothetical protein
MRPESGLFPSGPDSLPFPRAGGLPIRVFPLSLEGKEGPALQFPEDRERQLLLRAGEQVLLCE